jgi:hypothetical protein
MRQNQQLAKCGEILDYQYKTNRPKNLKKRHSAKATQTLVALFINGHEPPVSSRQIDETIQAAAALERKTLNRVGV